MYEIMQDVECILLMQDVIHFNCRALVASVPFFNNADPYFVSEVPCFFKKKIDVPFFNNADSYFVSEVPCYPVSIICFNLLLIIFESGCTPTANTVPVISLTHIFQGGLQAQIWSVPARSVFFNKSLGRCNLSPVKVDTTPHIPFSEVICSWAHQI